MLYISDIESSPAPQNLFSSQCWTSSFLIQVAEIYSPNMKKRLLLQFLDIFRTKRLCEDHLVLIMQMLIFPILEYTFQNGQTWEVVDTTMIDIIFDQVIDPPKDVHFTILTDSLYTLVAFSFSFHLSTCEGFLVLLCLYSRECCLNRCSHIMVKL